MRRCCDYTERFDRLTLTADRLRIGADEIDAAVAGIPAELMAALDLAATRIEAFHRLAGAGRSARRRTRRA